MNKAKRQPRQVVGFPLEAQFVSSGYELLWDNRIKMSAPERRFFRDYIANRYSALIHFGAVSDEQLTHSSPSLRVLHSLSVNFLRTAAQCSSEAELNAAMQEKFNKMLPKLQDSEKMPPESIQNLYNDLVSELASAAKDIPISTCIENIYAQSVASQSICFNVEENISSKDSQFRLLITCRYKGTDLPIAEAVKIFETPIICQSIAHISAKSALAKRIYNGGNVLSTIDLTQEDMYVFLKELEMYSENGIICRVPNRWKKRKTSMSLGISLGKRNAGLGADSILSFDINLSIDGEKLSEDEIQNLLNSDDNVFLFRGKWIELKRGEMRSCLAAYENMLSSGEDGMALTDAIRAFLAPEHFGNSDDDDYYIPDIEFSTEDWLSDLRSSLNVQEDLFDVSAPSEYFTATLRPYQLDGVTWLNLMRKIGLGACLSDDMGLGKTVQAIAVLEQLRHISPSKSLIVIPASLLQNWQDELTRFAPYIKYRILHSSFGNMTIPDKDDATVYITTYAMLSRLPVLRNINWECMILDEAQAIKNPQTMQSKAAKQLSAKFRIAMTGTPIENSITDLWSIFDFLNPKLFRTSIELLSKNSDSDVLNEKLRKFIRPFILRRLKTDKTIISDLPEKIEMKNYCHLTQRQAVLYKQITNSLTDEITYMRGMERRGLVLSSILRLKQICNHPDQYTGHGAYLQNESGKFSRLIEICEEIKARHERVLVFTQFKELCEPLSNVLRDLFGQEGLIIHGSTSVGDRGAIVEKFNNPDEYVPYIVLSLRAGGVGLNLTAANHVIHFDRWWNPAVENQATDRAFRIGQTNNVIVHKLICTGTLEEKIDKLIEHKSSMASDIVESDVKLTELSNDELLALLHMD